MQIGVAVDPFHPSLIERATGEDIGLERCWGGGSRLQWEQAGLVPAPSASVATAAGLEAWGGRDRKDGSGVGDQHIRERQTLGNRGSTEGNGGEQDPFNPHARSRHPQRSGGRTDP